MSDSSKPLNTDNTSPSSTDDFSRQISRIAVAQICEAAGFNSANLSAIDTFSEILIRFITEIGKSANFYSELANRTSCNEFDVIHALEDLSSSHGFASASDSERCLLKSGVLKEISEFVELEKEIPFARSIPKYPIKNKASNKYLSFAQLCEDSGKNHIPNWLPAFPDPHTYVHTPVWNEKEINVRDAKVEQAKLRRKGEKTLLSLQKKLSSCNGAIEFDNAVDESRNEKGKNVVDSSYSFNPFFAQPFPAGEKDVMEIATFENDKGDEEKKVSVLDVFAPAIEAARTGNFDDNGHREMNGVMKKRPFMCFKLGVGKKSVEMPLNSKEFSGEKQPWFLRNDERDDKKRRAGLILKEAMDNPHELRQL